MFRINDDYWQILAVSPKYEKLQRSDGTYAVGCCDYVDRTIYINKNLYGPFLKKVLRHEITHAAMFSYDVFLTFEQEELLADLIATYGEEIIEITNTVFKKIRKGKEV